MSILWYIMVVLVAAEHLYILWFEMFAWETKGKEIFGASLKAELFPPTKTLAANQGLYNGFLAAGLMWSLFIANPAWKLYVSAFFFGCVLAAGLYGWLTASRKILYVQGIPAALGLLATFWLMRGL